MEKLPTADVMPFISENLQDQDILQQADNINTASWGTWKKRDSVCMRATSEKTILD